MASGDRGRLRTLLTDVAVAGFFTAFMVVGTIGAANNDPPRPVDLPVLTFALVVTSGAFLVLRRLQPLVALAGTAAATTAYLALDYPFGPILLSVAFAAFSVAVAVPTRRALTAAGLVIGLVVVPAALRQDWTDSWVAALARLAAAPTWILAAGAVGFGVRAIRRSAEQTRAEARRQQAYEERLQTAREVHDIVGHGLAAISMQAGVALHVLDRSPQRTRELLESIRDSSQHSLDELRATLAVFRASGAAGAAELAPPAGLDGLGTLVTRMADSGVPVDVATSGPAVPLLSSVDHAAYRIVQESLTNVLRHAGPTTATVRLGYAPDRLTVEVADRGRGAAAAAEPGQGVAGMRARAESLGGTLAAGPAEGGGFRVYAELPLDSRGTP